MLTSKRVGEIIIDCGYLEEEMVDGKPVVAPVVVYGVTANFGLHPDRLKGYTKEISEMIDELPAKFKQGWSFLNMCNDKNDVQWTGMHQVMESLMVLGMAIGRIKYCVPKEMWDMFPGGMPYIMVV